MARTLTAHTALGSKHRDIFDNHCEGGLQPGEVCHILKHGRAFCGREGEPTVWGPNEYWIGFTNAPSQIKTVANCVICLMRWKDYRQAPNVNSKMVSAVHYDKERRDEVGVRQRGRKFKKQKVLGP